MDKTSIGDRMKENYENRSKTFLTRRTPVIIRADGCCFHTFTKGFKEPFDLTFMKVMQETALELCKSIQGCKLGYVQSDEISLLLTDYDTLTTDAWFGYSVQKICSVTAAMATLFFNRKLAIEADVLKNVPIWDNPDLARKYADRLGMLNYKVAEGAYFDARAFNIPQAEVTNYFIWRQQDATRNSIESLARAYFSDKECYKKNTSQLQDMLHEQKGVNWNNCLTSEKRGTCIVKDEEAGWVIDTETPIFTKDRDYVEKRFPKDI